MAKLAFVSRLFRRKPSDGHDEVKDGLERRLDAGTHDMVQGKGVSPTGAVMDFESDSKRPR